MNLTLTERLTQIADEWLLPQFASEKDKADMVQEILQALNVPTTSLEELRRAMSVKLKLKSTGYEATIKGNDPAVVVTKCVEAHKKLQALKAASAAPAADRDRDDLPMLILAEPQPCPECAAQGWTVEHRDVDRGITPTVPANWEEVDWTDYGDEGRRRYAYKAPCPDCDGTGQQPSGWKIRHGAGASTPYQHDAEALERSFAIQVDLSLNTKGVGWDVTARAADELTAIALIRVVEDRLQNAFFPKG